MHTVKQNHTKHGYFSFFSPLKVTGKLEIESLGQVHGGEQGRGELTRGETGILPQQYKKDQMVPTKQPFRVTFVAPSEFQDWSGGNC